jgi:hypothetical protein
VPCSRWMLRRHVSRMLSVTVRLAGAVRKEGGIYTGAERRVVSRPPRLLFSSCQKILKFRILSSTKNTRAPDESFFSFEIILHSHRPPPAGRCTYRPVREGGAPKAKEGRKKGRKGHSYVLQVRRLRLSSSRLFFSPLTNHLFRPVLRAVHRNSSSRGVSPSP